MASTASRKISAASWASNADATAYTNVSTTPVDSGVYIVVSQARRAAGQSVTPTLAGTNGWNVTWTARGNILIGDLRLTVFTGTIGASPSAGQLTATFTAETQDCHVGTVFLLSNANEAPVQIKMGSVEADTTITVTFDSGLTDVWNGVLMVIANAAATGAMTAGLDDVDHYQCGAQHAAPDGVRANARFSPINQSAMTASGFTSSAIAAALIELDHDGSDVSAGAGIAQLVGPGGLVQVGA